MDEARRRIQQLAENGLLPPEQAAFLLEDDGASGVAETPVLERQSSSISQVLIADGVGRIKIDNPVGDLRVSWPSREGVEVEVERRVGARTGAAFETFLRQIRVIDMREGGTLKLRVHSPETPPEVEVEARASVRVPSGVRVDGSAAGALELCGLRADGSWSSDGPTRVLDHIGRLRLHTDSGDVDVEDCRGGLDLHVENGNMRVERCVGELQLSCFSGDVRLEELRGEVRVSCPDGELRVSDLEGTLDARVGNGRVEITRARVTELDLSVESGDVTISGDVAAGGSMRIRVASGNVRLLLDRATSAELSLSGDVACEVPLEDQAGDGETVCGRLGAGNARIVVVAGEGSVRVGWLDQAR